MKTLISVFGLSLLAGFSCCLAQGDAYTQATSLYAQEDFRAAIQMLQAPGSSQDGNALKLEADCYQKMGELEKALSSYDRAEQGGCNAQDLYLNRGICRLSLGVFDAAEADLNRHLAENEQDVKTLYYLGQLEYMRFNNMESLSYLTRCTTLDPEYTDALYLQGGNYADLEEWDQAEQSFRNTLHVDKDHAHARRALAMVLIQQNRMQDAIAELDQVLEEEDTFMAEVYFYKAEAYYSIHDEETACEFWTLSDELGDPDAAKNLLNICERNKGKLRKKKATFAKF